MDRVDHGQRCSSCGAEVRVPAGSKVRTMITGASGKPNMHVLVVDGEEVHRCEAQTQIDLSESEPEIQAN